MSKEVRDEITGGYMLSIKSKEELLQIAEDLLAVAEDFAPVIECTSCGRYTREGYVCRHCGTDCSQ